MKGGCCLGTLAVIAGVAAGLYAFAEDPGLPDQAAHVWASVTSEVAHVLPTAPARTATPITLAPSLAPTAATVAATTPAPSTSWSIFDCAFAVDTLREDAQLDGRAFAEGLSPASDPYYYAREAQGWASAATEAAQQCGHPGTLTGSACSAPPAAFALAIISHQGDEILHPANTAWDNGWIASYRRLTALWATACGGTS